MRRLQLVPDKEGYRVTLANSAASVTLDGPAAAYRALRGGEPHEVECTWKCSPADFGYLQAFYDAVAEGAVPFVVPLVTATYELKDHVALMRSGSLSWTVDGSEHRVSAKLWAIPQ